VAALFFALAVLAWSATIVARAWTWLAALRETALA
jgi:hypothetical protein